MPKSCGVDRLTPKARMLIFRISTTAAELIDHRAYPSEARSVAAARLIRWGIADKVEPLPASPGGAVTIDVGVESDEFEVIQSIAKTHDWSENVAAKQILYAMLIASPRLLASRRSVKDAAELMQIINQHNCDSDSGVWIQTLALALRDRCSMPQFREWLVELRDAEKIRLISTPSEDYMRISLPLPDGKMRGFTRLKSLCL